MSETLTILDRALSDNADEDLTTDSYTNSPPSTVNALSSVINYIITDAFDLSAEESTLVSHNLSIVFAPLNRIIPTATMGAVRQELTSREYSKRLMKRYTSANSTGKLNSAQTGVKYATVESWVESLSEMVLASYPNLRPMISSSIIGGLHGLLTELGVTSNERKSRASLYLPNSVRHLLNNRR